MTYSLSWCDDFTCLRRLGSLGQPLLADLDRPSQNAKPGSYDVGFANSIWAYFFRISFELLAI